MSVLQDTAARHPAAKSYEQDYMTALLQIQHDHQKVKLPLMKSLRSSCMPSYEAKFLSRRLL